MSTTHEHVERTARLAAARLVEDLLGDAYVTIIARQVMPDGKPGGMVTVSNDPELPGVIVEMAASVGADQFEVNSRHPTSILIPDDSALATVLAQAGRGREE